MPNDQAVDPTSGAPMTVSGIPLKRGLASIIGSLYEWHDGTHEIDFWVVCLDDGNPMWVIVSPSAGPSFLFPTSGADEGAPHEELLRRAYAAWRGVS